MAIVNGKSEICLLVHEHIWETTRELISSRVKRIAHFCVKRHRLANGRFWPTAQPGDKMTQNQEPIRIIIEEEDIPLVPDKQSTRRGPDVKSAVNSAGQAAGSAAKKAWDSESRKKVTGSVSRGVASVTAKSSKAIANKTADIIEQQTRQQVEAMKARAQEIDWKEEAQKGAATGLQWLSQRVSELANRFTPAEKDSHENP